MLNERLLAERGIRSRERKDLEALHEVMDCLTRIWDAKGYATRDADRGRYQRMVKRLEYLMQDKWGFPRNENKHTHRNRFNGLYPAKTAGYTQVMREPEIRWSKEADLLMRPEKAIEEKVVKWARTNGWLAIKFTPKGDVGWPDRIFISPRGLHCWVEFKAPGKYLTPLQAKRRKMLHERHARADWFDNADEAIEWLRNAQR